MRDFVGRTEQLALLDEAYVRARQGSASFVWLTGRRRIGKSRLIEHFLESRAARSVFFQAPRGRGRDALGEFIAAVAASNLPGAGEILDAAPGSWRGALDLASAGDATSETGPTVIVIDEFPYLHEQDDGIDAELQHTWDRVLERRGVMLVCVGSDLSMMERMLAPDRPLYGRPTLQIRVPALSPRDIAGVADLGAADAIDAHLVIGGFPELAREWRRGESRRAFLRRQLDGSSHPFVTAGERVLDAELPRELQARATIEAVGVGERTFSNIMRAARIPQSTLHRTLTTLVDDLGIVERTTPVAVPPGADPRYRIADPYLRFWLRFVGPYTSELDRGRPDLVLDRIEQGWLAFRGTSVEPVVRDAMSRLLLEGDWGGARDVGAYWTRTNVPEVDIVGVDDLDRPRRVGLVGSIKWRERAPFDGRDAARLIAERALVPGSDDATLLVAVSRSGMTAPGIDIALGPQDLLKAWPASRPAS